MNIAIGNKTFGRNFRFGVGAFVTALSVATIVGVGIWHLSDSSSPQTAANAPVTAPVVRPVESGGRTVTPVHYYLVSSEADALALLQADFEHRANAGGVDADFPTSYVINVSTPEGARAAQLLQDDLFIASQDATYDPSVVQVHDLTAPPAGSTVNDAPRPAFIPSDSEPATIYVVGSEAEKQALLLEADTAAAVEGAASELPDIIVVETSEDELQYSNTLLELSLSPDSTRLIDLR